MADEMTLNARMQISSLDVDFNVVTLLRDVAGANVITHRQTVTTSEAALVLGSVVIGGYVFMRNNDATNYIKVRPASGGTDMVRLRPGDIAIFRFDSDATSPYVIADTASCELEYVLVDG